MELNWVFIWRRGEARGSWVWNRIRQVGRLDFLLSQFSFTVPLSFEGVPFLSLSELW